MKTQLNYISNPLSLNIVQMAAGFTFESEQNEASWLNPLTTLILRTTQI